MNSITLSNSPVKFYSFHAHAHHAFGTDFGITIFFAVNAVIITHWIVK